MNTNTQTNIHQTLFGGDNELMKIDLYLDKQFGQGSVQALTIMAEIAELKKMLAEEVVHFVFEKTDGTTRDAYGTRAIDVIRKYDTGSTTQKPQRAFNGTFPYFDIEKGEWRCFRVDRFVKIDKDYVL
ncbi:MAG: DUF2693 domain-containing protein [Bacteroidales bacterium]|nr:DUF2693 domain-containing protein [Bacteroidales bacterium]